MSKFVGFEPTYLSHYTQYFTSDGTTASFPLGVNPGSSSAILVNQDGVIQRPGLDYTVQAGNLVFNTVPAAPSIGVTNNLFITFLGIMVSIPTPAANSVGTSQLQDISVTNVKMALSTEAQFDSDTRPATTEFVQRALGNLQGEQAYTASQAIAGSQVGKLINFSGAGVTLTLPNSANVPVGSVLTFYGNGFGGTIQKAAGDILLNGTFGSISSFNLVAHDKAVLVSIGSAGWYVIGGEVGLMSSSSFAASLATNGYQKLPSGVIIQWGHSASTNSAVTLPITYPNAILQVFATPASDTGGYGVVCEKKSSRTKSSITINGFTSTAASSAAIPHTWFTIGY